MDKGDFYIQEEEGRGPILTPGSTITLTTGMAADLKPKASN